MLRLYADDPNTGANELRVELNLVGPAGDETPLAACESTFCPVQIQIGDAIEAGGVAGTGPTSYGQVRLPMEQTSGCTYCSTNTYGLADEVCPGY